VSRFVRIRLRIGALRGDERGFTLIELLIAIAAGSIVLTGAILFLVVSFRQQNTISSRSIASDQAETGLQQLTRDLREAMTNVSVSNSGVTTSVSFQIPTPNNVSVGQTVTWTCPNTSATSVGTCTRNLAGTTKTEIAGVTSMAFTPYNNSNPPSALSLPVSNSTSVSELGMALTVQITGYTLHPNGVTPTAAVPGSSPITLQATADLRNFS
jgi:prepilin-type N-terminal cleavage/methylation domain-containing protein